LRSLIVDATTATALAGLFRPRALYDVRTWARALAEETGLTFDQWVFPEGEATALEAWSAFLRAREIYFTRLRKNPLRNVVEVAEWTPELAGAAQRYAQAFRQPVLVFLFVLHRRYSSRK
jgi:hypothetical protein